MSLARLTIAPRVLRTYDADASAYIAAVEFADGQALEQPIRTAITEFVVGCKTRGIWESIKSCCFLCGARTIAGARVPLRGNAPILTSFVGNYNRESGLRRVSGSFDINRNNNTDPQNNKHISIYPTSFDYGSSTSNFRAMMGSSNTSGSTYINLTSSGLNIRCNTSSNILTNQAVSINNLIGVSILSSSQSQLLYRNNISIINIDTITPDNANLTLFTGTGLSSSLSRIAFYSVGENLNLKLLNDVITNYMNALYRYFYPSSLDSEASLWISSAERSGGLRVNATTASAVNAFCNAINNAGIRDKFYRLNLFCGPNLTSCLTPLYRGPSAAGTQYGNTTDQSTNFSSISDYTEYGLLGDGSSKSLETGLLTSTINSLYPNVHLAVYGNNTPTTGAGTFIQTGDGGSYYAIVGEFGSPSFINMIAGNHVSGGAVYQTINSNLGMNIINRTSTTLVRLYRNGSYVNQSTATQNSPPGLGTWTSQTFRLFASRVQDNGPGNHTNLRACGYSIGSSMTESQLTDYRNAMQTFQTTLQRQV